MKGLMLAAPHSGAGKTLLTMAILRGLKQRDVAIAPFKAGPDYIDPIHHQLACGYVSMNLDPWGMRPELIEHLAMRAATDGKKLIVEAMMGLFDGAIDGSGTPADLAYCLQLPIILIIDCTKMSHSISALVSGFHHFSAKVSISGIILNKVGSARHEKMLRQALSTLPIPIVGLVYRDEALVMAQRYLGLSLPDNVRQFGDFLDAACQLIAPQIDWDALIKLADSAISCEQSLALLPAPVTCLPGLGHHIAIAHDAAFCFTYPHIVDCWQQARCQISLFSPLEDEAPPLECDSIYLPGGYPELYAEKLGSCHRFKQGMRQAACEDKFIYGECGGFMVLGESLEDKNGDSHPMLGLLPLTTSIKEPRLHLGYRKLENISNFPLPQQARGHEFHYSCIVRQGQSAPLFQMRDAVDEDLGMSGMVCGRVAGSFVHLIDKA